jgi:hypothetical protein
MCNCPQGQAGCVQVYVQVVLSRVCQAHEGNNAGMCTNNWCSAYYASHMQALKLLPLL